MATITPTFLPVLDDGAIQLVQWTPMTFSGTDAGAIYGAANWSGRSVQVLGTFGAGGSLRIEGSNDGTNFAVLTDPQGNALDFTAAKIEQVQEEVAYIRPRVTAGDGTTSLTVVMCARRPTPLRT